MAKTKHSIIVPLYEFKTNGGILRKGRTLLHGSKKHGKYYAVGVYEKLDRKTGLLILRDGSKLFPSYEIRCFISIPCTPIYK